MITPLGYRVLVRRLPEETKLASGLYIPEKATAHPQRAEILALGIGNDADGKPVEGRFEPLAVGQKIYVTKYPGQNVDSLDNEDLVVVDVKEIVGILEEV